MKRGGKSTWPQSWDRCQQLLKIGHSPAYAVGLATLEGTCSDQPRNCLQAGLRRQKGRSHSLAEVALLEETSQALQIRQTTSRRIVGRVGIEPRCPRVETRSTIGHWEGDTVIGRNHKYDLVTLVERKTGFALVRNLETRQAAGVATAISDALKPLRNLVDLITFDSALEFVHHARATETVDAKVYFAAPYSS